ncbi:MULTISPECIES: ABC transporter ATP-binding protein [Agrobacterium tumefaciens complex]|uniref:ABC transporter ATP-binding protein n=1 Tax=Agrobacterium tumefaciens complex TaxID=1183400 RepID=UPI0011F1E852|nr:ABC transporter ATP-binding protein [Agrobacterium tumefaciens]KAA1233915.1 ABC transporter ATP-binding protein [Agrobacterium tumefaciens]MCW8059191.1 ABC transporter ATP-binding protein [Agrobacterium tumefaciens]MCW8147234.1 ABC transporter ATP-binding protein [Agrobacterium tumefaciens]MQB37511.1 ABC transporter ATP-binding protein [Agrobacterium tumefaciens]NSX87487.1 ABC transporter ATP-binding protein [Agrobacterium tumefaciens]
MLYVNDVIVGDGAASIAEGPTPLLDVRDLTVSFPGPMGSLQIVRGLSYKIPRGQTLGIVGESGCGKTMTSLALLGLVAGGGKVGGRIDFTGKNLASFSQRQWQQVRGREIAMIFQEPMTAMNPVMPVGRQIAEVLIKHEKLGKGEAQKRAVDLLAQVGIPSPARRAEDYPHQLSGGMRQRAMIAMALACRPQLLIADEPTTALDVTIQAQILDLMLTLQDDAHMSIQFISHNLAVVSEIAHAIMVMYAGKAVEYAPADTLFANPLHPYTQGLIQTLPDPDKRVDRLYVIPGRVTSDVTAGCRFAKRCPYADETCRQIEPDLLEVVPNHHVACHRVKP